MSKLNDVLDEAFARLSVDRTTPSDPITLQNRIVKCYNDDDLMDKLKSLRNMPGVGIVYEGMRSMPEEGSTGRVGVSSEAMMSFILVQAGDAIMSTDQKKTIAIDYLNYMRNQFLGQKSVVTGHFWHFMVESPAELKSGMVVWVQRWTVPIQMPPIYPPTGFILPSK